MGAQYGSCRCLAFPCLWVQDVPRAPGIQRQNSAPALSILLARPHCLRWPFCSPLTCDHQQHPTAPAPEVA